VIAATDITKPALRALRRAERSAPTAVQPIREELARVRRRFARGDYRRAAAAAGNAAELVGRLEHDAALPGWHSVRRLALELRELVAVLRLEARAAGGAA
jgi:hypothetical protein